MPYSIIRRLLQSLFLLWGVLTLSFLLLHLSPGSPADKYLSPQVSLETLTLIRHNFGFDQPIPSQYLKWLRQWLRGDLGFSFSQHRPVSAVIREAIPPTLELTLPALALNFLLGTLFGALAAFRAGKTTDRVLMFMNTSIYCLPGFWLALMLVLIFSVQLGWLPSAYTASLDYAQFSLWHKILDKISHLTLPVLTLALAGAAATTRYVREALVDALQANFVRVAVAKGLSPWQIFRHHLLRHILLPLISLLGLSLPFILGGAILIEVIFAWPGMGRLAFEAIFSRDYPLVLALSGISAIFVIAGNFFADLLYGLVDPRIKLFRS